MSDADHDSHLGEYGLVLVLSIIFMGILTVLLVTMNDYLDSKSESFTYGAMKARAAGKLE